MTGDAFDQILDALRRIHDRAPGLRFGQILGNAVFEPGQDNYYTSDVQIAEGLRRYLSEIPSKTKGD